MDLTIDQALQKGVDAHKAGKIQEADQYYTAILKANPKHPDANHNMGVLAVGVGKLEAALPFFKNALDANPTITQYWVSLIDALIKLERRADAKAVFDQAKSKGVNGDKFEQVEVRLTNAALIDGDETDEEILGKAIYLRETGKYNEAIDLLLHQKMQSPTDPNILSMLSHCYSLNDNLEKAKIYLDAAKDINPNIASIGWNETRILLKKKKVNEALAIADKANKFFPDDVEGMVVLGSCLRANGNLDESQKYLNQAIKLNPNYAEALIQRGLVYLSKKNKIHALTDLEKAYYLKPHIKQVWDLLISLLVESKNYARAISVLIKMIEVDPKNEKNYSLLALCNQHEDNPALAIKSFEKILEVKPNDAIVHLNLGLAFKKQNENSKALENYQKALTIKPDFAEAYNSIAVILKDQGKLEHAIEALNKALSIKPDFAEAYNSMAVILKDQGKLEHAIEALNKAFSIKPDFAEAYNSMAIIFEDQGKPEDAIEALNKALNIKPALVEAHNNRGNLLRGQGKLEGAIEAYNKALSIKPNYAEAYNNIGIALKNQGKLDEALEAYNKALSIRPNYAEAHKNLSFILLNSGRLKEGLDEYEWRWKTAKTRSSNRQFSQPLWDGKESLTGKTILLWSEQGVGDTINWSSCLSFVASEAGHCILECQQKLVPLLARSFPNIDVKPENRSLDPQRDDFDFHLPMGSLYRHFISKISKVSSDEAFLVPDPARIKYWRKRLKKIGKGPYIGISWKSSNIPPDRMPNYASISEFSPIFRIPNVTFINLQYRDFADDLTKIQDEIGVKVHNFDDLDQFENLEDVTALCAALDIVVSTHNVLIMIASRVGALTKFASWRQSPWNNLLLAPKGPALELFERNTWESWDKVITSIAEAIIENNLMQK